MTLGINESSTTTISYPDVRISLRRMRQWKEELLTNSTAKGKIREGKQRTEQSENEENN